MVEVEAGALGFQDVGAVDVVMVQSKGQSFVEQLAGEAAGEFCLARTTGTGDAYEERAHGYCLRSLSRAATGRSCQLLLGLVGKDFFLV